MNNIIINNLFEFWDYLGIKLNISSQSTFYKSVSITGSDWPIRVYDIEETPSNLLKITELCNNNLLPRLLAIQDANDIMDTLPFKPLFSQVNMALDLKQYQRKGEKNPLISMVKSEEDAFEFADIATQSFGYRVDGATTLSICEEEGPCKLILYKEHDIALGCGIIFIDSHNVAGLHMIGTLPSTRGSGIGTAITEWLVSNAIGHSCKYAVLNASKMGEGIYSKLGFKAYGTITNYLYVEEAPSTMR